MTDSHQKVHQEIDRMTEIQVEYLKQFLAAYPSPLAVACRNARNRRSQKLRKRRGWSRRLTSGSTKTVAGAYRMKRSCENSA